MGICWGLDLSYWSSRGWGRGMGKLESIHLLAKKVVFLTDSIVVLFKLLQHAHDLAEVVRHSRVIVWSNCNEQEGECVLG